MDTKHEDIDKEKKEIEREQDRHKEDILEVDEAAESAEGLTNRATNIDTGVEEDRDVIHDIPLDVPESDIIR